MMLDFPSLASKYNIQSYGCLHIGSSTGQEAELYDTFGIKKVIWIEAIQDVWKELQKHIAKYPEHIAINECIGDVDGKEVIFHISNNEKQSSSYLDFGLHKEIHPTVEFLDHVEMKTKRVDTVVKEYGLDLSNVDLLNIDLQGSELFALKSMGVLLGQFKYAILEVNEKETYQGCALIGDIDEYMARFGFVRKETGTMVGGCWSDAFYLNETV